MHADFSEASGARRPPPVRRVAPLLALLLLVSACAGTPGGEGWEVLMPAADAETTRITGSVTYMDLEGGLFVIRGSDGANYDPTNLPDAYREDGLSVEADVVRRDDVASIGMVGTIVDVVRIRRADGQAAAAGSGE